jgi:hypothetical protein
MCHLRDLQRTTTEAVDMQDCLAVRVAAQRVFENATCDENKSHRHTRP